MQRSFKFKVKDNSYTVSIPNPAQIIEVEQQKALITSGTYRQMNSAGTVSSQVALDYVDMHAYLIVMVPELIKDMRDRGVNSILEMDIFDLKELKGAYKEQFVPFTNEWMAALAEEPESEDDK